MTIIIAVVICLCASYLVASKVDDSVVSMILQVSEIGKPYGGYIVVDTLLKPVLGDMASWLWMGGIFVLCACFSFWTRNVKDFFVSSAPIVALIPIWTYSQGHDHTILIGWFFSTLVCALKFKRWQLYCCLMVLVMIFAYSWLLLCYYDLFNPAGRRWIYQIPVLGFDMITVLAAALFSWQAFKYKLPTELYGRL